MKNLKTTISSTFSGFTFIEIMIVVAIIGMLATFFVSTFPAAQRRARDAERRSDIKQYQTAMESYANKNNGNYPASGGTINISGTFCSTTLGLPMCPDDPKSTQHYYVNSTSSDYVIWTTLEDPTTTTTFFITCSTGESGDGTTAPSSAVCTL